MKITGWVLTILTFLTLTSCRSLRNITAKDQTTSADVSKKSRVRKDMQFIEGIEVTPGSVVTSKHKPATTKQKRITPLAPKLNADSVNKWGNIETAHFLQIKYAIILDATVEKLTNLPLLQKINDWWGTAYCMGGNTKGCIDCSSYTSLLVHDIYYAELPRTAQEQFDACEKIGIEDLQEGDLVFFGSGRSVTHVGLYLMNNKFTHASTSNGVTISDLNEAYWQRKWKGAGRVVVTAPSKE